MNALAIIDQPSPEPATFDEWIAQGRDLFARHRQAEWALADWLAIGKDRFRDEPQMELFLAEIGVDPKRALADAKVASLIPPTWRSDKVSFSVCRQIAKVEDEAARQRMIKQAVVERWNEKTAHHHVVEHKVETGALLPDDDDTSRLSTEMARCWNRAGRDAREYFFRLAEMAAADGFRAIDEDVAL